MGQSGLCGSRRDKTPNKCQFGTPRITFMGHVLPEKGIDPADEKVKAVYEAREPGSATEVRSFHRIMRP